MHTLAKDHQPITTMSDSAASTGAARGRRIVIIRHAQTEENEQLILCANTLINLLKHFTLPRWDFLKSVLALLRFESDSQLSEVGIQQATAINILMKRSALLQTLKPSCIIVSSLRRTMKTARVMLPDVDPAVIVPCPLLDEATPIEYVLNGGLKNRIRQFEDWLSSREDISGDIVIVGHCQYLKHMLGMTSRFKNCDVYESFFGSARRTDAGVDLKRWTDTRLLMSCPLAVTHPIDKLKAELLYPICRFVVNLPQWLLEKPGRPRRNNRDGAGDGSSDPSEGDEAMCRICQMTSSESPGQPLIRPCKCSGSLMHVHVSCLATWRATSVTAFSKCEVCGYKYVRKQSQLAELVANPTGILCITMFIVLAAIFGCGLFAAWVLRLRNHDIIDKLCRAMDVPMFWRHCAWRRPLPSANPVTNLSFCDPGVVGGIEAALIGSLVVGLLGLVVGLFQEAVGPHNNMIGFLLGPVGWLSTMDERARLRVAMGIGSLLAARYVYLQVAKWARHIALMGETIEPYYSER